ncbi:MAG: alpha/beta fold hydrolase [Gammaproteobacteria bacterium]|nr:alpha/beta fold hydrolase [Gammaproteobacteria bacterium]
MIGDTGVHFTLHSVPAMAADMLALIDQPNADAVHLVGHDYGAMLAWEMVLAAPERFASFSALSVGHPAPLTEISIENLRYHWYLALANTSIGADLYLASKGCLMRELLRSHPEGAMITHHARLPRRPRAAPQHATDRAEHAGCGPFARQTESPAPTCPEVPGANAWALGGGR